MIQISGEKIKEQIRNLPVTTGVYFMKDVNGAILYVGKAANLYERVSSYFGTDKLLNKIEHMVSHQNAG